MAAAAVCDGAALAMDAMRLVFGAVRRGPALSGFDLVASAAVAASAYPA
jgi:hypothetical protein